jgi:hypothetical protein
MTRKTIVLPVLTACLAAAAMLTLPSASATWGHDDCTQDRDNIANARYASAETMMHMNNFRTSAEACYNRALADMVENAGSQAVVDSIAANATLEIVQKLNRTQRNLGRFRSRLSRGFRDCRVLLYPILAQIRKAQRAAAIHAAELRDLLKAAADTYGPPLP